MAQFKRGFRPSNFTASVASTYGCPPLPIGTRPARGSKMRKRTSSDLVSNDSEANGPANDTRNPRNILRLTAYAVPTCARIFMPARMTPSHFSKSMWFAAWIVVFTCAPGNLSSTNGMYIYSTYFWLYICIYLFLGGHVYWIILMSWNLSPKLSYRWNLHGKNDLVWHWVLRIKS